MKNLLHLLMLAGILIFFSCGSGNKTKPGKDSLSTTDSISKSPVNIESWMLYKLYSDNYLKALDEKNVGKKFRIKNLVVQSISKTEDGSKKIDCFAFDTKDSTFTESKTGKSTRYLLNGKDLTPIEFGFSLSFVLSDPKDAGDLKNYDTNEVGKETVYTYFNTVTIEGEMTEAGANYISFGKCKVIEKQ